MNIDFYIGLVTSMALRPGRSRSSATSIIAKRVMCLCNAIDAAAVWADLDEKTIVPVNYAIKFLSLILGVFIGFKHRKNGVLKGVVVGLVFMLLTFFIFSAMNGFKDINFNWIDLIFLPIGGGIIGAIKVNLPSRK